MLREGDLDLPAKGWGRIVLAASASRAGRSWTDHGTGPDDADGGPAGRADVAGPQVAGGQPQHRAEDRPEPAQGYPLGLETVLQGQHRDGLPGGRDRAVGRPDRTPRPLGDHRLDVLRLGREH
jgi:hypothetical protein